MQALGGADLLPWEHWLGGPSAKQKTAAGAWALGRAASSWPHYQTHRSLHEKAEGCPFPAAPAAPLFTTKGLRSAILGHTLTSGLYYPVSGTPQVRVCSAKVLEPDTPETGV